MLLRITRSHRLVSKSGPRSLPRARVTSSWRAYAAAQPEGAAEPLSTAVQSSGVIGPRL